MPTTLDDLLTALREGTPPDGTDLSDLPTFGGDAPGETDGIWSWDETRLLVGEGADLRIVTRGEWYRRLRETAGLSQAEAGALVGTHANTIARRERGELPIDREAWLAMRYVTRTP